MKTIFRICGWLVLCLVAGIAMPVLAGPVGVIYPDNEAYRRVFDAIITGIEDEMEQRVDRYRLAADYDAENLHAEIRAAENQVVLALGQRAVEAINSQTLDVPVVQGAILPSTIRPEEARYSTIFMVPDPEFLFRELKRLAPRITEINVIFNPENNQFLIDRAAVSVGQLGLELKTYPVTSIKESAKLYKELMHNINPRTSAVWLLQDSSILDSEVILPELLAESWERDIVLFSSSLVHVSRGVLFSLFPDNLGMGKSLARIAKEARDTNAPITVKTLQDLKLALNMRTAKHLKIDLSDSDVDLVFPTR